jgi:hypothetical protein
VQVAVNDTIKKFGQLDALMTNTGFGVIGCTFAMLDSRLESATTVKMTHR